LAAEHGHADQSNSNNGPDYFFDIAADLIRIEDACALLFCIRCIAHTDYRADNNLLNITRNACINEGNSPGSTIADRCHWARLRAGMDIVDVARAAGLSSATVSKVENGRQVPIVVTIRALASVLKQPIWFLGCYETLPVDTLGQCIRKARLYHGLTKKEFADRLGVNEKSVRLWEADLCTLASDSQMKLAPYLVSLKRLEFWHYDTLGDII